MDIKYAEFNIDAHVVFKTEESKVVKVITSGHR